jgi:glycosyltransferase involved in cell wall biosynthesis
MLEDALTSVLNQTYEDFEVIVVDDGSPEALEHVVKQFNDDRIDYYRLQKNQGANVARNTGIEKSTGEYLAFLDDDDRWEPTKLEEQIRILDDNPSIGVVYTGQRFIDDDQNTMKIRTPNKSGNVKRYLLKGGYIGGFSSVIVRQQLVSTAGKPDSDLPILQDTEWWLRLSQETQFASIKKPLVVRRIGNYEQIGDKYEQLRDIAYPKVYHKHKQTAANEGIIYKFIFKSYFLNYIGSIALSKGKSHDARVYLLKSLLYNPLSTDSAWRFIVSLGGSKAYYIIRSVWKKGRNLKRNVS